MIRHCEKGMQNLPLPTTIYASNELKEDSLPCCVPCIAELLSSLICRYVGQSCNGGQSHDVHNAAFQHEVGKFCRADVR